MQATAYYFLPGQEAYGRLAVLRDNGHSRLCWQIIAPRDWAAMAQGRPVEELPRLLARFSPSHHLAAAHTLDRLFGVEPPELAVNFRELIRQVDIYRQHLRRFYFLLTLLEQIRPRRRLPASPATVWRQKIQQHLALAREAAAIIGGRPEHPLTAVVGGISRFLKPEHYPRLSRISGLLLDFTRALADFLQQEVLTGDSEMPLPEAALPPLATLTLTGSGTHLRRQTPEGEEQTFPLEEVWQRLGRQQEPWTYEPLVYWQAEGWSGWSAAAPQGLFLVGPLARWHQGVAPHPPERELRFDPVTAFRAVLTELLAAAAVLPELTREEKLTGPQLRTIPEGWHREGYGAVEGPGGPICLACRVDDQGVVEELQLLDPDMINHAPLNLLLSHLAPAIPPAGSVAAALRTRIAMGLLPW